MLGWSFTFVCLETIKFLSPVVYVFRSEERIVVDLTMIGSLRDIEIYLCISACSSVASRMFRHNMIKQPILYYWLYRIGECKTNVICVCLEKLVIVVISIVCLGKQLSRLAWLPLLATFYVYVCMCSQINNSLKQSQYGSRMVCWWSLVVVTWWKKCVRTIVRIIH